MHFILTQNIQVYIYMYIPLQPSFTVITDSHTQFLVMF